MIDVHNNKDYIENFRNLINDGSPSTAVDIDIRIYLSVNGHSVTERQIDVLKAIKEGGSKNAAAKTLGISPPVVHRYMKAMEEGIGCPMLKSDPLGTRLTDEALEIIDKAEAARLRNQYRKRFVIACTPVTQEKVMETLSRVKVKAELIVSCDRSNIRKLREHLVDMIIIDDPVLLFDLEEFQWFEVGSMGMIHVDKGKSHIEYMYGAQRMAYEYFDSIGKEYSVDAHTYSTTNLIESGKSFFIEEAVLLQKGIKLESSLNKSILRHTVNAVYRKETACVKKILSSLKSRK